MMFLGEKSHTMSTKKSEITKNYRRTKINQIYINNV